MGRGLSIRIFLADGRPEGLRRVEVSNWTGVGLVCSRSEYTAVRAREDFGRPGVYVLDGSASSGSPSGRIYIGEADELRSRIDNHARYKDFWTTLFAFASKDENLNKAHVRYLESRLIVLANKAKRVEVDNGTAPPLPHLSEADAADMDAFLETMLLIIPLLGLSAFEAPAAPSPNETGLRLVGAGGVQAVGEDRPEGFVVQAGAIGRLVYVPSTPEYIVALRQHLRDSGVLVPSNGALKLTRAWVFDSPSSAAGVLLGRSANGRVEWKDLSGRTLKSIQDAALAQ